MVKFAERNSENRNWDNVFNGGVTTSGRLDKRRPQVDSAHRIGLRSQPCESSDCSVDGLYGGQSCRDGILKIRKWENVFNGEQQPVVVWMSRGHSWI